jgi:hypothetical protein
MQLLPGNERRKPAMLRWGGNGIIYTIVVSP